MILETTRGAATRIASDDVVERNDGDPVEFGDDGRARVNAELGEYLADTRDGVEIAKDERNTDEN